MGRDLSILQNLVLVGVDVIEIDGWKTRGSTSFDPDGSVNHHTAGPMRGEAPSLGICINGRSDVPGPLCNGLLGRDRKLRLISAGRANHAGRGGTRGLSGNSEVWGLEVEHVGTAAEAIDPKLIDVAARCHAAAALTYGFDENTVVQHWEWTTRKIDFRKGALSPDQFRAAVDRHMRMPSPEKLPWVALVYRPSAPMQDGRGPLVGSRDNEIGETQIRLNMLGYKVPVTRRYDHATAAAMVRFKKSVRSLQQMTGQRPLWGTDPTTGPLTIGGLRFFTA
mgnify:FL=1